MRKLLRFSGNLLRETTSLARAKPQALEEVGNRALDAAMAWLARAQDATPDGGVSEGYHLYHGWLPSYPETTGYIIETFLDYADATGDRTYRDRAIRMGQWLLEIQRPDGSFPDSYMRRSMVFDTGQILFGLVRCFQLTGDESYRASAVRAGDWLVEMQDPDGAWRRGALNGIPHSYYARVGWGITRVHQISDEPRFRRCAELNAAWTLAQQRTNGWFNNAAFSTDKHQRPFTHTIAYTFRGMLEMGLALGNDALVASTELGANGLANVLSPGSLPSGTYDATWAGDRRYSCLTGNAQLAIVFYRLAVARGSETYLEIARALTEAMLRVQQRSAVCSHVDGAIAGSRPIWGDYIHFAYPNWATKFFAEALLAEKLRAAPHTLSRARDE